jgi:hypothetical protein
MPTNDKKPQRTGGAWGRDTVAADPRAPQVYIYGRRVTERDVIAQLEDLGGDALADYRTGKLPRDEAYRMTAAFIRQLWEMP